VCCFIERKNTVGDGAHWAMAATSDRLRVPASEKEVKNTGTSSLRPAQE
jgi:hypothetical protein